MSDHDGLYAPTFMHLHGLRPRDYSPLKRARPVRPNIADDLRTPAGRAVCEEIAFVESWPKAGDIENECERRQRQKELDEEMARRLHGEGSDIPEGLLEWYIQRRLSDRSGCCFDEFEANDMTSCAEGHVFCLECARKNAEMTVGSARHLVKCMDGSGCQAVFRETDIPRFLDPKTIALKDRLESSEAVREVRPPDAFADSGFDPRVRQLPFLRLWRNHRRRERAGISLSDAGMRCSIMSEVPSRVSPSFLMRRWFPFWILLMRTSKGA